MRDNGLWSLVAVFVPFSLVSIGGAPSIFAGIQHQSVEVHQWVSAREFVDLFAIARAAPGPGSMLVTLLGWKVAGWLGALVATLAFMVPSSLLCFAVANIWSRYRGRRWHKAVEEGLAPIGAGLILAGVIAIFRVAGFGPLSWIFAGLSAVILAIRPRINPLLILAGGAAASVVLHPLVPSL
jgi:chromate transporter